MIICADGQKLEGHASIRFEAEHRFLPETHFVGRDDLLDGLVRYGIVRMDKVQDIRRLATHFP